MRRLRCAALVTQAALFTASAFATNYAVGTCQPNLTSYTTISQAVGSVPSGSVIEVCPGNYSEQVVITQPLTLEGVPGATSDAVITVPAAGLSQSLNFDFIGSVTYQLLVNATGPVNITNLAIDGTSGAGRGYVAGIVYQDTAGTVNRVAVHNQTGGGLGIGVLALTSIGTPQTVTVENSVVRSFDGVGVFAISGDGGSGLLTANILTNIINGSAGTNTVGIDYSQAGGTGQSNLITDAGYGVVLSSASATVIGNTIASTFYGAYINAGSAAFTSNKIDANGFYGIYLQGSASNSTVQANKIANSSTAVYGCGMAVGFAPPSGFSVTANDITDASVGLQVASGNTTSPNAYYVTFTNTSTCP